jgi:hypothetical protein
VAPPAGPAGLRYCSGDDGDLAWRLGVSGSYSDTKLVFSSAGGSVDASFAKYAVMAAIDRRLGDRWTVGGGIGTTVTGNIDVNGVTSTLSPGPLGAITASFRPLDEGTVAPFVLFSASMAASLSWATASTLTAFDVRLGVAAGKTIADVVTPYVLARAFGGPVLWSIARASATGTDAYHYQVGAGASVRVGRVDVFAEGVPLGERAVVLGAGAVF